jgi:phytanoyl-CoA hydroxylase
VGGVLTPEQIATYDRDGLLVVPDFVSPEACDRLKTRAIELVEAWEPSEHRSIFTTDEQARASDQEFLDSGATTWCFFEEEAFGPDGELTQPKGLSINKIGHAQHDLDDEFERFAYNPDLAEVASDIGMVDARALQSMYIFKQPKIGGEVTCHQDATFLYTDPITVTGFWFAIEDATIDNGCLWAAPGGHRTTMRQRFRRTDIADPASADGAVFDMLDDTPLPATPADVHAPTDTDLVPLEVSAGTLVVLHGLLPHWSGPNRSATSRHAYSLHAISGAAEYPTWNWLQRPADMPLRPLAS